MPRIAIVGGGPAGYEAALVAAELGAEVTLLDRDGMGGSCVLTDCVPSKTLVATAEVMTALAGASQLGVRLYDATGSTWQTPWWDNHDPSRPLDTGEVDIERVFHRVRALALAQSLDVETRVSASGVRVVRGSARFLGAHRLTVATPDGGEEVVDADVVLIATGGMPRVLPTAVPDGERILDWTQIYDLPELPEHLVVVGSGVTGAEFASAFRALGARVTLVSSRERVLPGEDGDAAAVIEEVFARRGIEVVERVRAQGVRRTPNSVLVDLDDGRTLEGSHALMAVGSVPNTGTLGLDAAGVRTDELGFIIVDRVSRTSAQGVYAAGDCTGVLLLASVAAMQGRIAMWHALGEAVAPLRLGTVAATVFTDPEIATVGVTQAQVESGKVYAQALKLPLATNARAKMQGLSDGFVKVFCRPESGKVLGGVVVAARASELVLALSLAVQHGLNVDQLAHTFSIYPSLSGSITEAARRLHQVVV